MSENNTIAAYEKEKIIKQVSFIGIVGNIVLSAFKFFAGIVGHSSAMLSDAIHSLSDVLATVIAFIGVKLAEKKEDKCHPYGHERFECVASLILAIILLVTAIGIGYSGVDKIIHFNEYEVSIPSSIALIAAIVSIVVKEGMFWYTRWCAKKINSTAFMADAWHHRSDALSSIGSLVGIGGAMMGYPILDSVASVVISCMIVKVGFSIFRTSLMQMTDHSCGEDFENAVKEIIMTEPGVLGVDLIRTRMFGERVYVDVEISVDGNETVNQAHKRAELVHDKLEHQLPNVKHVMVHVNPYEKNDE